MSINSQPFTTAHAEESDIPPSYPRPQREIAFGIPIMAIWDYVERRRILARSRTSAGYMGDIEGFTVWKQMKRQGLRVYGGEAPRIIQEVAEIETALALVSAGVGVAILPEGVARRYTRSLVVISLKQERIRSEIGLAFLKLNPPPLARRLIASATTAGLFEPRSRNQ